MIDDSFPTLLTQREAAELLGVWIEDIATWAREGKLLAAARSEAGEPLFYRYRVERDGPALVAAIPIELRDPPKRAPRRVGLLPKDAVVLPCGCVSASSARPSPILLCNDARSLLMAHRLAEAFSAAASHDPFFRRAAKITREAFTRHITNDAADQASMTECVESGNPLQRYHRPQPMATLVRRLS